MHQHAARSLHVVAAALSVVLLAGCQPPAKPAPRTLTGFAAGVTPGVFSHDVVLANRNNRLLRSVDLTVTLYYEAKIETVTRHWAYWNHEQRQTINVAATGTIQRVVIEGVAVAGAGREAVLLKGDWLISYPKAK